MQTEDVMDRTVGFDPAKAVMVALLVVASLFVWSQARSRVVAPFDRVVTERICIDHGTEIGRESTGFERSNRFGLFNRSEGYCEFGVGPNGEAPITLAIDETEPGSRYRGAKWLGIIVQLGIVSLFLRLVVDPAMELARFVRPIFGQSAS